MPTQDAALIHDDGSAFTKNTLTGRVDVVVPSPSSYMKTTDLYLGILMFSRNICINIADRLT
jgi:hypothetical protein